MTISFSGGGGGAADEIENDTVTLDDLKREVKRGGGLLANFPQTRLADSETISYRQPVPSDETLLVHAIGAVDDGGANPGGYKLEIVNKNVETSGKYETVFEVVDGEDVAHFRLENRSGGTENLSGFAIYVIDPS